MTELEKLLNDIDTNNCKKQQELVALLRQKLNEYDYSDEDGLKRIKFLEKLPQYQLEFAGKLLILSPWQKMLILAMYGFKDKSDKTLLHTEVFLEIGKKNGKTFIGSGLLLFELLYNKGAQIYTVATDYEQAGIAFDNVVQFISNHPKMKQWEADGIIKINRNERSILYTPSFSKLRSVSEDRVKNIQGRLPSFILYDECASYKNYEIITKLDSAKPKNAISLYITTAETNMNNPGYFLYQRSEGILSGKYKSDSFLPVIYELDEEDLWTDETKYKKANPNLDITTTTTKILCKERDDALIDLTGELERGFKSYKLNLWSRNNTKGFADEDWNLVVKNGAEYKDYLTDDKLATYPCYGAVDLSKSDDYTAYSLCFYIPDLNKFYFKHHFYIPKGVVEKKIKIEKGSISKWVDDGLITPTMGGGPLNKVINYQYVYDSIEEDFKKYSISGLAIDASFEASKFSTELEEIVPSLTVFPFMNSWSHLCPANRRYADEVFAANIIDDNPVMTWMISCVRFVYGNKNNLYFEKVDYKNSPNRIDGIDTSVMALGSLIGNVELKPRDTSEENKKKLLGFFDLKY